VFIGMLLANKQKIASLVNIDMSGVPDATLLARLVSAVNPNASRLWTDTEKHGERRPESMDTEQWNEYWKQAK